MMRTTLAIAVMVSGCATGWVAATGDDGQPAGDAATNSGGSGGAAGSPDAPDAPPAVAPCTPADWTTSTFDSWGNAYAVGAIQPRLRFGAGGLEVAYAINPNEGKQKRLAMLGADGTWTLETSGTKVWSEVARAVDSHGTEHECWAEASASGTPLSCGARAAGSDTWTTATLAPNGILERLAMVVDRADRVFVTYRAADQLSWAVRDPVSGTWTSHVFPMQGVGTASLSTTPLAVDREGCVHVAEVTSVSGSPEPFAVEHGAMCPGQTAWTWDEVTRQTTLPYMSSSSLVIDALDRPNLALAIVDDPHTNLTGVMVRVRRESTGTWGMLSPDGTTRVALEASGMSADLTGGVYVTSMPTTGANTTTVSIAHVAGDDTITRHAFGTSQYAGSTASLVDPFGRVHVVIDRDNTTVDYATACGQ